MAFPLHKQYDVISYVCMPCGAISAFVCWAQHFLLPNQFRTCDCGHPVSMCLDQLVVAKRRLVNFFTSCTSLLSSQIAYARAGTARILPHMRHCKAQRTCSQEHSGQGNAPISRDLTTSTGEPQTTAQKPAPRPDKMWQYTLSSTIFASSSVCLI